MSPHRLLTEVHRAGDGRNAFPAHETRDDVQLPRRQVFEARRRRQLRRAARDLYDPRRLDLPGDRAELALELHDAVDLGHRPDQAERIADQKRVNVGERRAVIAWRHDIEDKTETSRTVDA